MVDEMVKKHETSPAWEATKETAKMISAVGSFLTLVCVVFVAPWFVFAPKTAFVVTIAAISFVYVVALWIDEYEKSKWRR